MTTAALVVHVRPLPPVNPVKVCFLMSAEFVDDRGPDETDPEAFDW